jgi:opacity protein-like surface antigen
MSRSFSKFILSLVLVLGITSVSHAQEDANMPRPLTKSGSAAFVFDIAGLGAFGLTPQPIGTVSAGSVSQTVAGAGMKYFIADDMAIKVLLAFGTASNGDTAANKQTTTQFGIAANLEYHFKPVYSTSPYVGGGIAFASASQSQGETDPSKISASLFGIGVFAGFDWFFTRGIAIGAEYGLGFATKSASSSTAGKDNPAPPSSSAITLGLTASGNLHAVVYF